MRRKRKQGGVTLLSVLLRLLLLVPISGRGSCCTLRNPSRVRTSMIAIGNCRWTFLLLALLSLTASSSASSPSIVAAPIMENVVPPIDGGKEILIVFSDVDGTLVHYPKKIPRGERNNAIIKLPPSTTGMRGVISSKTLSQVQDIRKKGAKFVLVSGMRTSTFLNRLPYLPRADAYCTEAGGRIFYPVEKDDNSFSVKPEKYDGCTPEDLEPFSIVEDMEWRKQMETVTGKYGLGDLRELASNPSKVPPLNERDGLLWDFARFLISKGYTIDTEGYSSCFRVNQKQQEKITASEFAALTNGEVKLWDGLGRSVNLSCVDFYPAQSGKKNCCQYLAEKFCPGVNEETLLYNHAVCLCDDDNDIEMATACGHAYLPEVTAENMAATIEKFPEHFTFTGGKDKGHKGPAASEVALSLILSRLVADATAVDEGVTEGNEQSV